MKAWVLHGIGDIRYEEIPKPPLSEAEVLVEVKAVGICGSDIPRIYRDGAHRMPLIPGHEFSGQVVEARGREGERWLGKRVGVFPLIPCYACAACRKGQHEMCRQYGYLGSRRDGGFAEYAAAPVRNLIELPAQVTFEQAAMLEPTAVAVHAMRRVSIAQNDTVAVCGLGTIGQLLVMLLRERGIENVFALGNKDFQKERALALGLPKDHFCSRPEDAADWLKQHTAGAGADVFFECVGKNKTASQAVELTAPGGTVCLVGNPYTDMIFEKQVYWKILRNQLRVTGTWNSSFFNGFDEETQRSTDWQYALGLLGMGKITPEKMISHRIALEKLGEGLRIMREKSEDYLKIMAFPAGGSVRCEASEMSL